MNSPSLTELGVASVCAYFILERVFGFLLKWRSSGGDGQSDRAGDKSADYWRRQNREAVIEGIDVSLKAVLSQQAEILSRMEARTGLIHELMLKHGFVLEGVQKSLERLSERDRSGA